MRVAIVDDEPAARRMLRESCGREPDIQVVGEFSDGRTALQALAADPPDLLFLDIQMDGLTGLQLLSPNFFYMNVRRQRSPDRLS